MRKHALLYKREGIISGGNRENETLEDAADATWWLFDAAPNDDHHYKGLFLQNERDAQLFKQ